MPEFEHSETGIVMVLLPGGDGFMGSPDSEEASHRDERPRHRVTLDRFLLAKYEVSQEEWLRVMGRNPAFHKGDRLPVERVSWKDCISFCERVGLSLVSEAQWEYACRAGSETPFSFGDTLTADQANFDGHHPYGGAPAGIYRKRTVPVDQLPPNRFGLHNLHGNVWEWCEDTYDPGYYGQAESRTSNPVCRAGDGARTVERSIRGGSWYEKARYARSAGRGKFTETAQRFDVGFRPAYPVP